MSGGVPRRRKRRTRRRGAWGDGPVPPPLSSHLRSARSFGGYPNWCPSLGCSSCGAQGALSPPPPLVVGPAGWPATHPLHLGSSAPTRWGAPHGGVPQVVPRCGAGGAPRWWGPTLLGTPHPASPRLTCFAHHVVLSFPPSSSLTVSLVLTVSLRRTTRLHGYLTNDGDSPGESPPPQEGSRERPTDTAGRVCSGLAFGFTNSSSHWGSPCGPPVWSTPVVGHHADAPAQLGTRATAGRSPRHTIRSPTRGWVTLRPSSAPQLRHTPEGGATTPTPGVPDRLRPAPGGHHNTRAPQKGPHTRGTPHRHTTKPSHSARGPARPRRTTTDAANTTADSRWNPTTAGLRVPPSG